MLFRNILAVLRIISIQCKQYVGKIRGILFIVKLGSIYKSSKYYGILERNKES